MARPPSKRTTSGTPELPRRRAAGGTGWDPASCRAPIEELWTLREHMLAREASLATEIAAIPPAYRASARNLAHYLELRREDRRPLQERLAAIGVSSLGRAESHVLANLDKVLGILHHLAGLPWADRSREEPPGIHGSRHLLEHRTAELLGAAPPDRAVRIMVTLPSEAAADADLVHQLAVSGMDIARINCAHDDPTAWTAMAQHVRRAADAVGRPVRVLMDLAGPKLRTGAIEPGPAVLRAKPSRDAFGQLVAPARIGLRPSASTVPVAGAPVHIGVDAAWLAAVAPGDRLELVDARGADRSLRVVARDGDGVLAESKRTVYLIPGTKIERQRHLRGKRTTEVTDVPRRPGTLLLTRGDRLHVTRDGIGRPADGQRTPATLPCTLPEVFAQVRAGERIWFDDGRIGGVIRGARSDELDIEITQARTGGETLAEDKGINLPDSALDLPALTPQDIDDLATVARHADLVGLSFVQRAADIDTLRTHLAGLGAGDIGIVLKIETRRAFENLPALLFSAMRSRAAGVMIARGDLAVECGYERLAEVQEEILWMAEAAHLPVIWATQVLETLAKTGMPSRAEITDAAMGERAECVMLNKGPHILDAMRTLDDILKRMASHQAKKRSLLRALGSWSRPRSS